MGWGPNAHLPNIYVQRILASCLSCRCWKKCWNIRTVQMNGVPRFNQQKCWMKQIKEKDSSAFAGVHFDVFWVRINGFQYWIHAQIFLPKIQMFQEIWIPVTVLLELCAKRNIFVAPLNLGKKFRSLGPCKEIRRVTSVWWIGPTVLRKVHFLHRKGQLCLLYSRLDRDIELWLLERTLWKVFFWGKFDLKDDLA